MEKIQTQGVAIPKLGFGTFRIVKPPFAPD
jgi:hypothetical protein